METPILFIIFNRPDTTKQTFEAIKKIKPTKLYVAADGPRESVSTDKTRCEETRKIIEHVDWPCEVKTLFQEKNLGCKWGMITAIDWLFKNEEKGIILEDDCVPGESFFNFCTELLDYYKDNEEIMHISGNNYQDGVKRGDGSYYFSKYTSSWGWATWRRAWSKFHPALENFSFFDKNNLIKNIPISKDAGKFWIKNFRYTMRRSDNWDSLWMYTVWLNDGMSIIPNENLVKNIGFGEDATHTKEKTVETDINNLGTIKHPSSIILNEEADEYVYRKLFHRSLFKRVVDKIKNIIKI